MVPDAKSSDNRLRILLKSLLRKNGFQCTDIKQVINDEPIPRTQSIDRHDGLR
jgi:hypothetical protein